MSTTPVEPPEGHWWNVDVSGWEKLWLGITIFWAIMLFGWMAGWAYMGNQNPTGKTIRITNERFQEKVQSYQDRADEVEIDGTEYYVPPEDDIYIAGLRYGWAGLPVKLEAGKEYMVHMGSYDVQHGFSVRKQDTLSKQLSLQILPGYEWIVPMTFNEPGTYHVICNEFCGYGHSTMHSKFKVVE
jgi:cytochrome c oxidase subunit 2